MRRLVFAGIGAALLAACCAVALLLLRPHPASGNELPSVLAALDAAISR